MERGAGLPGAEKPLSHASIVSHFTFKTYMSVNLMTTQAHILPLVRDPNIRIKGHEVVNCTTAALINNLGKKCSCLGVSVSLRASGTKEVKLY